MKKSFIALSILLLSLSVQAQEQFTHFLRNPILNPFTAPQDALLEESEQIQQQIEESFRQIKETEDSLMAQKQSIENHGLDALHFLIHLQELVGSLSPREKAILLSGNLTEISNNEKLASVYDLIQIAKIEVRPFLQNLDNYIQDTLDLSMAYGFEALREYIALLPDEQKSSPELKKSYSKLEYLKKKYTDNKHQYGQPKDTYRTSAYKSFFTELRSTFLKIEESKAAKPSLVARFKSRLVFIFQIIYKIPDYSVFAMKALKLLKAAVAPEPPTVEKLSLNSALNDIMGKIGEIKGIPVEVEGRENLPLSYDPQTVNIFAASHRDAIRDQVGIAGLGVNNLVFFAAVNNFVPEFLNKFFNLKDRIIRALNKNYGLIVVGPKSDPEPIEKALRIVRETPIRNFLIFPGGRLPEGMGATMGVRSKFASDDGLLGALEAAGYKINIVPISMRHNATLFNHSPLTDSPSLSVRVEKNIDDESRKIILKLGGSESLGYLLRYGLIDDLVTNHKLIWGQVRASKVAEVLKDYLGISRRAPVRCELLF